MKKRLVVGNNNNVEKKFTGVVGVNKRLKDMTELKPFEKEILLYLLNKEINYTYQITEEVVRDLNNIHQIGSGSIKKFLTRLKGFVVYEVVREVFTYDEWAMLKTSNLWKCSLEYLPGCEDIYLQNIFNQSKLFRFEEFCIEKNIGQIKELTLDLLEEFKYYDGVGKKKFSEVLKELFKYMVLRNDTSADEVFLDKKIEIKTHIIDKFGGFTVEELKNIFGKALITYGVEQLRLEELHEKTMREIGGNINYLELEYLINIINNSYSFSELCANGDETFLKTEDVLKRRYIYEQTLKEIGEEYELSKERVRQLEQLGIERIEMYIEESMLIPYLRTMYKGAAIDEDVLITHIGAHNEHVLEIIRSNDIYGISFVKEFKKCLLMNVEDYISWRNSLKEILPDKLEWNDYKNVVNEQLSSIGLPIDNDEVSLSLLEGLGYQRYGTFLKYGYITIHELVDHMFLNDFTEAFGLKESSFKEFRKCAHDKYHFSIDSNIKSFEGRIRSVKEIVLVGKRTYKHIRNIHYSNELHELIKNALNETMEHRDIVNTSVLFNELKESLYNYGVDNKYYLYSLIKYYFSDVCTVGEGNTLNIYFGDSVEHAKREDDLFKCIEGKRGPISKKEILDELSWESYKLEDILCKSKILIPWDNQTFIKVDDFEEKETLLHIIDEMCQQICRNGYATAYSLLSEVMTDPIKRSVFEKNKIDASFKVAALIKKSNDEIKGHKNFLHHVDSEISNIDLLIKKKFNIADVELIKDELVEFLIRLGYSPVSAKNKYLQLRNKKR